MWAAIIEDRCRHVALRLSFARTPPSEGPELCTVEAATPRTERDRQDVPVRWGDHDERGANIFLGNHSGEPAGFVEYWSVLFMIVGAAS